MILWTTGVDRKSVAIPILEISHFQEYGGHHTQTLVHLKSGAVIECVENIVPLTEHYKRRLAEQSVQENGDKP